MAAPLPVRLARALGTAWRDDVPAPRRRPALPKGGRMRAFAAAAVSRLLGAWPGTTISANKSTRYQAHVIRHRARELRENSPLVARYARLVRDNIVGPDGVTLQCIVPSTRRDNNTAAATSIETAFYDWALACTPDGRPLVDVLGELVESWKVEGEGLLEILPDYDAPCGMWVSTLDADLLDHTYNVERTPRASTIVQGIEYDARGRVVQYWLLERHPSEGGGRRRRPVRPDQLLYLAERQRPQQARGVSKLHAVMTTIEHLDRLAEALVVLNRVTAAKMGALIPGELAEDLDDEDGTPPDIEQAPAEWWTLPKGWDVKMLDPGQPTAEFDPFQKFLVRMFTAGAGISYASGSGDYRGATYSSARMEMLSERDGWMTDQATLVSTVMVPLFRQWLKWAELRRAIRLPAGETARGVASASKWHPRRWPWVDPMKDAQAVEKLIALKLTSRTREANRQGLAFDDILAELESEANAIRAAGLEPAAAAPGAPTPAPAPARPADEDDDEDDDVQDDTTSEDGE